MDIPAEELAYWAGYIDAEGAITLVGKTYQGKWAIREYWYPGVQLGTTDEGSVLGFRDVFGGKIYTKNEVGFRPGWQLHLYGAFAVECLEKLLPYLRTKKQLAVNVLLYNRTFTMARTNNASTERDALHQLIRDAQIKSNRRKMR